MIKFPLGAATNKPIVHADFAASVVVDNTKTLIDAVVSSGNVTLNLDIEGEVPEGAELMVRVTQGATGRNVALGTGFATTAPDLTGVASDVDLMCFEYWGGVFVNKTAAWQKVFDAA